MDYASYWAPKGYGYEKGVLGTVSQTKHKKSVMNFSGNRSEEARDWYHFGIAMIDMMHTLMGANGASHINAVFDAFCLYPKMDNYYVRYPSPKAPR
jgi:hypothetical protein